MSKAIEIQAPEPYENKRGYNIVFLGGSIEMDKAFNWQKELIDRLKDEPFIFLNPRRDDWDSSWKQTIDDPQFLEQVTWELNGLEKAEIIVMVFDGDTLSPISLLELGLHADSGKMIVLCPDNFWRKGNVDVVCKRYNVKQVSTFEELIKFLKNV